MCICKLTHLRSYSEIFVWVGRYASSVEKKVAQLLAQRLAQHSGGDAARPAWARATQVRDGAEPVSFRQKFADWYDVLPLKDYSKPPPRRLPPSLKDLKQPRIDVEVRGAVYYARACVIIHVHVNECVLVCACVRARTRGVHAGRGCAFTCKFLQLYLLCRHCLTPSPKSPQSPSTMARVSLRFGMSGVTLSLC